MLKIGKHHLAKAQSQIESLKKRHAGAIQRGESAIMSTVRTVEVGAAAFAAGIAKGKYGGIEVMGIPGDLGAGVALHLASHVFMSKGTAEHARAFGDGLLAAFAAAEGHKIGKKWEGKSLESRKEQGQLPQVTPTGATVKGEGVGLTDAERAAAIRRG